MAKALDNRLGCALFMEVIEALAEEITLIRFMELVLFRRKWD